MSKPKNVDIFWYLIAMALGAAIVILWSPRARAGQYVVERYTTGTAKIIELHDENDPPMPVYQQGRSQALCEGFYVLSGADAHQCVTVRQDPRQWPTRQR